jgi:hypothetical protein
MSHERNPTALRGAAEESNFGASLLQTDRELHHRFPGSVSAGSSVILNGAHLRTEACITLYQSSVSNLE